MMDAQSDYNLNPGYFNLEPSALATELFYYSATLNDGIGSCHST